MRSPKRTDLTIKKRNCLEEEKKNNGKEKEEPDQEKLIRPRQSNKRGCVHVENVDAQKHRDHM